MRHFEDFPPGFTMDYGDLSASREDIIDFARHYDPQPMHLDEEAAKQSLLGGLGASGLHINSLLMRLNAEHLLRDSSTLGLLGIKEFRWFTPVRPGDRVRVRATAIDARLDASQPDIGLVTFRFDLSRQGEEKVLLLEGTIMFGRRGATAGPPRATPSPLEGDQRMAIGQFSFTAENIVEYARAYEPLSLYADPKSAREGPYGGLVASPWHVACVNVAVDLKRQPSPKLATLDSRENLRGGVSPGWNDIWWYRPVRPDDTITFYREEIGYRRSASRPGWGIRSLRSTADNQRGEMVYSSVAIIFAEDQGHV